MRGRMKFEVRLLQQATKNQQKIIENRMFFGTSISEAFYEDFGMVLGLPKPSQNPFKIDVPKNMRFFMDFC